MENDIAEKRKVGTVSQDNAKYCFVEIQKKAIPILSSTRCRRAGINHFATGATGPAAKQRVIRSVLVPRLNRASPLEARRVARAIYLFFYVHHAGGMKPCGQPRVRPFKGSAISLRQGFGVNQWARGSNLLHGLVAGPRQHIHIGIIQGAFSDSAAAPYSRWSQGHVATQVQCV